MSALRSETAKNYTPAVRILQPLRAHFGMKFRAALRAPWGGPPRQRKLPEGGPVPAPRSEPDTIRDGVSRRASDKGDGPSPPQPKGQVHFRAVPTPSPAPGEVDLRGRKVVLKRAPRAHFGMKFRAALPAPWSGLVLKRAPRRIYIALGKDACSKIVLGLHLFLCRLALAGPTLRGPFIPQAVLVKGTPALQCVLPRERSRRLFTPAGI